MRASEIMKHIMEEQKIKPPALAKRLGISYAAIWDRLNGERKRDLSITLTAQTLRALDYKLVAIPASARIPNDGYEVEP